MQETLLSVKIEKFLKICPLFFNKRIGEYNSGRENGNIVANNANTIMKFLFINSYQ